MRKVLLLMATCLCWAGVADAQLTLGIAAPSTTITKATAATVTRLILIAPLAGNIDHVDFSRGTVKLASITGTSPYVFVYDTSAVGAMAFSARGFNKGGQPVTTPIALTVTVQVMAQPPPMSIVPNVVGLTQGAAVTTLTGAGLTLGVVTSANSATVPSGLVISQSPPAGSSVTPASPVALTVSLGPSVPTTATVPNVANLTQAAATASLTAAGLTTGAISSAYSSTIPVGLVLSQTPLSGTVVPLGSPVAITVSLGPLVVSGGTVATYTLGTGWATFGLALPQGSATGAVQVGNLPTQTDVKTTWPDGSIRFCIVTAQTVTAGDYDITPSAPQNGVFLPPWPNADVTFVVGGVTYVARLPTATTDTWLSGSLVREARAIVTPTTATGIPHPILQVVFDVRSYSTGGHRLDVTVQSVQDITAGAPATYDVTITLKGTTVYTRAAVTQPYMTRWRKTFLTAGLIEASVTPDFTPFYSAKALPQYLSGIPNPAPVIDPVKFAPLGYGDMQMDMSAPGGRPELAPYPNWIAEYLVHKTPALRAYMLASADLSGSWQGHITESDGETLITLNDYPNYWLDGRSGVHPTGPNATRIDYMGGQFPGGFAPPLETAHLTSLTFVPYLVTGDRFYLDQMKFWANFTLLKTYPGTGERQGGKGILMENQPRGFGWALRGLADLAAYIPDADPLKLYFRSRLQNNLDYLDAYAKTEDGGPFEFVFVNKFPVNARGNRYTTLWQSSYVGWAVDRAAQHGFSPTAAMRDRVVRTQVRFFNSAADGYPQLYGAPYYPDVQLASTAAWFSMADVRTQTGLTNAGGTGLNPQPFVGFYDVESRLMLQIGVRENVSGAQGGLDFLMTQPGVAGDILFRSGWAILP